MKSAECRQRDRNELYCVGIVDRKPTVARMLKGFPVRLADVTAALGETAGTRRAFDQLMKVKRLQGKNERANGQQFFNLFQASAKLNDLLLDLETEVRYSGECETCGHGKHDAGMCPMCGCGQTEVVGMY